MAFDPNYHQPGDDINNLNFRGYDLLADGGAHALATLAEDPDLRESLAGGATTAKKAKKAKKAKARSKVKAKKAKRLTKAQKAKLGSYLGKRLIR